jgi:LPS-assembly lipoprotein
LLASAFIGVAACGFRLQGRTPLPAALASVYLQAEDVQTDFVASLRKSLIASGVRLVAEPDEASAILRILEDRATRRVLSVSASNIPREYEITYSVRYEVAAQDRELLPEQELAGSRAFSFDERILLAKEHEEDILRQALADDLAGAVMRRLATL